MSRFNLFFFLFKKEKKVKKSRRSPRRSLLWSRHAQVCKCVLMLLYMCPHTTMHVPSCYYICFLTLPYSTTRSSRSSGRFFFFPLCEQAKAEVHEIQKEFQQEREDLLETVREQVCTVVKLALLLYYCSSKASMQV
jgi:hypothetical protein